jgi:dihydroxyacetone kinase phosphoprotein-dependent L subunit
MTESLNFSQAVALMSAIAQALIAARDELTALDAALGDGDLGRTVERGFKAIQDDLTAHDPAETDLGKLYFKLGKTFSNAAASSFGALFGTALMKGGMTLKGKSSLTAPDIAAAMQAALDALMERGKAKVGDKTMLDAIHPALEAMRAANTADIAASLRAAADAAQAGAEKTMTMQSMIGRASWQGERSIGQMDAGARAVALMLDAAAKFKFED